MPEPNSKNTRSFRTPKDLTAWLSQNHAAKDELWIKIFKKHTQKKSVTWNEVVLESLCWGWIDGVKKSVDSESYVQRITPRKPRSAWSKRNTEHVARLIEEQRMMPPGLAEVEQAKADGRWENAYLPPSETEVPADFIAALQHAPKAQQFFESLNKSSRYAISIGLTTAKKPETRERRFNKFMDMLARGEAPGFGFKKA